MGRSRRNFGLCAAILALSACVQAPRAPIDLPQRAEARMAQGIDWADADARLATLAPDAPHARGTIDRLTLFALILAQDPRVAAARGAVEAARRDALLAHKAASPSLSLSATYTNDDTQPSPWQVGATGSATLDFGARKSGRIRQADLAVVSAGYDLIETIWSERNAAQSGMIDVLAGERQVALGTELVADLDRQLGTMQRQADQGEISGLMLAPIRAQRAAAARALDDARARVISGRAAIATVLGVPLHALDGVALAWDDFDSAPPAAAVPPEWIRSALVHRADILKAMVAYDQTEEALRVQLAAQYPLITLGPGYTWQGGLVTVPLGLNLQFPAFDLNRSGIAAAVAHRAAAGQAVEAALADAQGSIETAAAERRAAANAYDRMIREEVPQAHLAATRGDTQLQLGSISRADWAALQAADASARLGAIDALTRLRQADVALDLALRRALSGPETRIGAAQLEGSH